MVLCVCEGACVRIVGYGRGRDFAGGLPEWTRLSCNEGLSGGFGVKATVLLLVKRPSEMD